MAQVEIVQSRVVNPIDLDKNGRQAGYLRARARARPAVLAFPKGGLDQTG